MPQDLTVARTAALDRAQSGFRAYEVRGQRVVLDSDLARLFGVETKRLNQQLRRNLDRFASYAFQLERSELAALRLQNVTSNAGRGGSRYRPWAFTEHGVVMAATILNSDAAIAAMRLVVETFVAARRAGEQLPAARAGLAPRLHRTLERLLSALPGIWLGGGGGYCFRCGRAVRIGGINAPDWDTGAVTQACPAQA
jgi:hypothetical protein